MGYRFVASCRTDSKTQYGNTGLQHLQEIQIYVVGRPPFARFQPNTRNRTRPRRRRARAGKQRRRRRRRRPGKTKSGRAYMAPDSDVGDHTQLKQQPSKFASSTSRSLSSTARFLLQFARFQARVKHATISIDRHGCGCVYVAMAADLHAISRTGRSVIIYALFFY
ncbi:hypothetical protein DAI22_12g038250 [Oryza sativa Japonica Group]|nr:hypothetical protein DAI22_12g038250 [Oryza sativa Japonica Group]